MQELCVVHIVDEASSHRHHMEGRAGLVHETRCVTNYVMPIGDRASSLCHHMDEGLVKYM